VARRTTYNLNVFFTKTTTTLTLLDETFTARPTEADAMNINPTPVTTVAISYIKGTSETISRILQPYNSRANLTGRNLNTRLAEHKRATRNGDGSNHRDIAVYTAVSRKVVQQKRTRQYRKVLRVIGFLVIDWDFRFFSDIERNSANKCFYTFSFLVG